MSQENAQNSQANSQWIEAVEAIARTAQANGEPVEMAEARIKILNALGAIRTGRDVRLFGRHGATAIEFTDGVGWRVETGDALIWATAVKAEASEGYYSLTVSLFVAQNLIARVQIDVRDLIREGGQ